MISENPYLYFADTAHSITVGEVTKPCLFCEGDEVTLAQSGAGQIKAQAIATVVTADFEHVTGNAACMITTTAQDGTTSTRDFTVWRRLRIQDGVMTEFFLKYA